jgi:hypothetical protein
MSAGDAQGLSGVDRALSIDDGELHGDAKPSQAQVVPLRRAESGARWR